MRPSEVFWELTEALRGSCEIEGDSFSSSLIHLRMTSRLVAVEVHSTGRIGMTFLDDPEMSFAMGHSHTFENTRDAIAFLKKACLLQLLRARLPEAQLEIQLETSDRVVFDIRLRGRFFLLELDRELRIGLSELREPRDGNFMERTFRFVLPVEAVDALMALLPTP